MNIEFKKAVERLSDIVRNAGKIMLGVSGVDSDEDVCQKNGDANYVTVFDLKVQNYIMSEVKSLFTDAVFIAEEKENDPTVLQGDHCFIIDPIDGTTNFIRNYKQSSISLAMVSKGETVIGIVYNPYLDELFSAVRGDGAFMNGAPISVSDRKLSEAVIGYGTSPYYKDELGKKTFEAAHTVFRNCADLRRTGSAAIDLANVAMGRIDGFFELRLSPWDIAAGYVIIKEAGGLVTDFSGNDIDFTAPSAVVAASVTLHSDLLNLIK
jgi:myo-inositol-1(or 4)-monophosphatase